jgi:hypothetical protein
MPESLISEEKLKFLLKTAVVEALEERRDLVRDAIEEALEDMAMVRAIEEGSASPIISPTEVYEILGSGQ